MIRYSDRARIGYARLYRPYNDIDVFVEDETCHNMCRIFINRILGKYGRVTRVIGMGSRAAVEKACASDQEKSGRPRIYIVDGDMDILRRKRRRRMKRLYRLRVYCFENLLVEESAASEVLGETLVDMEAPDILAKLQFAKLEEDIEEFLLPLWKLYAVVFDLQSAVETVNYSVHRFRAGKGGNVACVSRTLVRRRMREIVTELLVNEGKTRYISARKSLRKKWADRRVSGMESISGKHYIFPLLYQRCRLYGGYRDTEASLKVRLARHCDVKREIGLYRALRRELRKPTREI